MYKVYVRSQLQRINHLFQQNLHHMFIIVRPMYFASTLLNASLPDQDPGLSFTDYFIVLSKSSVGQCFYFLVHTMQAYRYCDLCCCVDKVAQKLLDQSWSYFPKNMTGLNCRPEQMDKQLFIRCYNSKFRLGHFPLFRVIDRV